MRKPMRPEPYLISICVALVILSSLCIPPARSTAQTSDKSLTEFNQAFVRACETMDRKADASFWADDGIDLIQGMAPMLGKQKIAAWLDSLGPQLVGARMAYCTVDWQDIRIEGDLAYEWGMNKQRIEFPPPQKPFESNGKILLILKRQPDHSWKVELESWSENPPREIASR